MAEPRIIALDLETLPNLPEVLKIFPSFGDFPGRGFKASITTIICFGYRILGEMDKAKCISAWDFPDHWSRDVNDDSAVCSALYEILKDADGVITQNGIKFDGKFIQTRLIKNNLPNLDKLPHCDTKNLASQNLLLYSNSLKHMAEFLDTDRKMENGGWELWVKVHNRDPESQRIMETYCAQDVDSTVAVYEKLKKFDKKLPNYNMFRRDGVDCCANCGSWNLMKNGLRYTPNAVMQRLVCKDCGTIMKKPLEQRPASMKHKPKVT